MDQPEKGDSNNPTEDSGAPKGTQAVIRAVRLLKAVSRAEREMSLNELCAEVGLSKPTAHRILSALISEGLVVQNPVNRNFQIGPEAINIGAHALQRGDLRSLARPFLESLATMCGETVTLEIPIHDEMLILDEVSGRHLIGARAEVGTRWPMHATSTGKAVLASLSPDELELRLQSRRDRLTPSTIIDADELLVSIQTVRRSGYATVVGELQPDYCAAGAAIRDPDGNVVAALSIGGPRERLTQKRLIELGKLVREAADSVSRDLAAKS